MCFQQVPLKSHSYGFKQWGPISIFGVESRSKIFLNLDTLFGIDGRYFRTLSFTDLIVKNLFFSKYPLYIYFLFT